MGKSLYSMTPKEIVKELDKYIIGQDKAKRMVAIALRNRYRRSLYRRDAKRCLLKHLDDGANGCRKD